MDILSSNGDCKASELLYIFTVWTYYSGIILDESLRYPRVDRCALAGLVDPLQ
jgi:hypothetical protein